jgi:hypothetical protein
MRVTDVVSITELSKLLGKSRPTVYKYIFDYENGQQDTVPVPIIRLFDQITTASLTKREVYDYCYKWFSAGGMNMQGKAVKEEKVDVKEIIKLIKANQHKINLQRLEKIIREEIEK